MRLERNIGAIDAYERLYGRRQFKVLPTHRISHVQGLVTITAQPDLWVRENKTEVLIKLGIAKKRIAETEMVLYLIRKAAIRHGYRVRARNVVYLDVSTGKERICADRISKFNRTFSAAASRIAEVWPKILDKTAS